MFWLNSIFYLRFLPILLCSFAFGIYLYFLLHYYSLAVGCVKQNDNAIRKQCITRYESEVTQGNK